MTFSDAIYLLLDQMVNSSKATYQPLSDSDTHTLTWKHVFAQCVHPPCGSRIFSSLDRTSISISPSLFSLLISRNQKCVSLCFVLNMHQAITTPILLTNFVAIVNNLMQETRKQNIDISFLVTISSKELSDFFFKKEMTYTKIR